MKFHHVLFCCILCLIFYSCGQKTLFESVSAYDSGVTFSNTIIENDTINPIDKLNIYNGGGVGIGDFNNDGLQDIYFIGNQVSNKLYLNEGKFKFKDVTAAAGVGSHGGWGRGVSVVDINNDGWLDIYVCNTLLQDSSKRRNLLFINQGLDLKGVPHFKEMAKEYGLDINVHSTMGSFFDFDNDGNLDLFLTVNAAKSSDNLTQFRASVRDGSAASTSRLYRNVWDSVLKHPVFKDVSKQAGILIEGYGHAASIVDINLDGWKDIYVTNDFLPSNILYINNHDGTFTDRSAEYFKHTSTSAMGQDFQDLNNDGLVDAFELDMSPPGNYRKKMFSSANMPQVYKNFDYYNYQYQYNRNTLQINQGPSVGENDSILHPVFSETGFLSGVSQTDWSWCPLISDFDNDGFRDIIVTNGYPRDVTDHDFIAFRNQSYTIASKKILLDQIPVVKIPNFAFRNSGALKFNDVTADWGLGVPTFSNGAACVDLDNDGAMDIVINNINDHALIYRNTARKKDSAHSNFLNIKFAGTSSNRNGIGTWALIYYNHGKKQVYENNPYRGYLSTNENIAHFGLGSVSSIDSLIVRWPNGRKQVLEHVRANQQLTVTNSNAKEKDHFISPAINKKSLFKEVTHAVGINYLHREKDFSDFSVQKLIPHKLSTYSPALAAGDLNGDGLDDLVVGGTTMYPAQVFLQLPNGKFLQKQLLPDQKNLKIPSRHDEGILLFDANGDGYPDMYIASGGNEFQPGSVSYQDRLFINDGKGNFSEEKDALPKNLTSKLCVKALDFNKDGKEDLFVSGRVEPWNYPKPVSSFILRNDSKNGKVKFTDVSNQVAPALSHAGMICDASVTDFDNDGWPDLILTGEWMPVTFLKNSRGSFQNITGSSGMADLKGWWNSIASGDFNHDGLTDYIVGNTGLNSFYQASEKYPVYITAKDFDKNGSYDAFPSLFLKDMEGVSREYPAQTRDDLVKQMIGLRVRYQNYKSFATATMDSILTPEMRKGAIRLSANQLASVFLRNDGHGKFTAFPLPVEAQFSQLNGMVVDDFDGDGNLDVAISGNDYGTEVGTGRYDALNGLLLKGNGNGGFKPMSILESGIYIPGDGKALVKLRGASGKYLLAASQRQGPLKIFELKRSGNLLKIEPDDLSATVTYKNSKIAKFEFYKGSSFLSQSDNFLIINPCIKSVSFTDRHSKQRNLKFN